MTTEAKTKALLGAIESRLTDISTQQHALAVEKARLGAAHAVAAGSSGPGYGSSPAQGQGHHVPRSHGSLVCRPASATSNSEGGRVHTPRSAPRPLTCSARRVR